MRANPQHSQYPRGDRRVRVPRLAAVAVVAVVPLFAWAGAAQADTTPLAPVAGAPSVGDGSSAIDGTAASIDGCPQYNFCLYQNKDFNEDPPFTGTEWTWDYFDNAHNVWLSANGADNKASSIVNYRADATFVAQFANGTGDQACIKANWEYKNLGYDNWPGTTTTMNNSITSLALMTSDPACS